MEKFILLCVSDPRSRYNDPKVDIHRGDDERFDVIDLAA